MERYIAIDDVCAWPNLTVLADGTLAVAIYNRPVHGRWHGDVEIWASTDEGCSWQKRGTAAPGEPPGNRMNVAAGAAANGDLIVIASGWTPVLEPGSEDPEFAFRRRRVSRRPGLPFRRRRQHVGTGRYGRVGGLVHPFRRHRRMPERTSGAILFLTPGGQTQHGLDAGLHRRRPHLAGPWPPDAAGPTPAAPGAPEGRSHPADVRHPQRRTVWCGRAVQ